MFVIVTADGKSRPVGNERGRGPPSYRRNVPAELYEPIDAVVTADNTAYTADNATWPTADGGVLEGATEQVDALVVAAASVVLETAAAADIADASVVAVAAVLEAADAADTTDTNVIAAVVVDEPANAIDALDATVIAVGEALLAEPAAAADLLDAEVIPAAAAIGGGVSRPLKPFPVEGRGFGVLPQLEGDAVGIVGVVGKGLGTLPRLGGKAEGSAGVAGRSAGQIHLVVRGVAFGERGAVAAADAILKGLSVAGDGAIGVRGSGVGMIVKLKAAGRGRHDDDEAAVLTFLLAA